MTPQQPKLTLTINAPVRTVEAFKALAKAEKLSHHALLQKLMDDYIGSQDLMDNYIASID